MIRHSRVPHAKRLYNQPKRQPALYDQKFIKHVICAAQYIRYYKLVIILLTIIFY